MIQHGFLQSGNTKFFNSHDSKIIELCESELVYDEQTQTMMSPTRNQEYGTWNNNLGRGVVEFLSFTFACNFCSPYTTLPAAKKHLEHSEDLRGAIAFNQREIYDVLSEVNSEWFKFDAFENNTVSPRKIINKMRVTAAKAENVGILLDLSKAKQYKGSMLVRDFFIYQNILPGLTIRSKGDIVIYRPCGGKFTDYLDYEENPTIVKGGSILKWKGTLLD
jgi:hypothetical protein